jgi:hypothetical protein
MIKYILLDILIKQLMTLNLFRHKMLNKPFNGAIYGR